MKIYSRVHIGLASGIDGSASLDSDALDKASNSLEESVTGWVGFGDTEVLRVVQIFGCSVVDRAIPTSRTIDETSSSSTLVSIFDLYFTEK